MHRFPKTGTAGGTLLPQPKASSEGDFREFENVLSLLSQNSVSPGTLDTVITMTFSKGNRGSVPFPTHTHTQNVTGNDIILPAVT